MNVTWPWHVTWWTFDNARRHMTAFRPISEVARSWSCDNIECSVDRQMDESQCCVNILDVEHAPHSASVTHEQCLYLYICVVMLYDICLCQVLEMRIPFLLSSIKDFQQHVPNGQDSMVCLSAFLIHCFCLSKCVSSSRGAVPAVKPEATAIGIITRWPLENNLIVWWAQVLRTERRRPASA